jgi:hypothetical protein
VGKCEYLYLLGREDGAACSPRVHHATYGNNIYARMSFCTRIDTHTHSACTLLYRFYSGGAGKLVALPCAHAVLDARRKQQHC